MQEDREKWMPWVESRKGIEYCPNTGPQNCRVIVFDCISYSVPWLRILTIDETTGAALAQEGGRVIHSTELKTFWLSNTL
jgi:hypothetical protein